MSTTLRALAASAVTATVLVLGAGTASADLSPEALRSTTDGYIFNLSLSSFGAKRDARPYANQLDWSSDGCSNSPDNPLGFKFLPACHRHDFGYRNYKKQSRFTEDTRLRLDNRFKSDLYTVCGDNSVCKRTADVYYAAVRKFGGGS